MLVRSPALDVLLAFLRLGCTSFGGPVAHIGYFRAEFVQRRRWIAEAEFADLVQFGEVRQDWRKLYSDAFAEMDQPVGVLAGKTPPADPAPAKPPARKKAGSTTRKRPAATQTSAAATAKSSAAATDEPVIGANKQRRFGSASSRSLAGGRPKRDAG